MRVPYPRTPHLPWSPGVAADDLRVGDLSGLRGREVVVTEKLDGENTTLYRDGLHARSLDSAHHPSRAWLKALHGRIAAGLPAEVLAGQLRRFRPPLPGEAHRTWYVGVDGTVGDVAGSLDDGEQANPADAAPGYDEVG